MRHMEPIGIEAHVGWREELWDTTLRVQGGAEVRSGWVGLELEGGTRIAPSEWSGHLAGQWVQQNDGSTLAIRDDAWTGGAMLTARPWARTGFGPTFSIGGELAETGTYILDPGLAEPIRAHPEPQTTAWLLVRGGVEARVGRIGVRLTFGEKASWLGRPVLADAGRADPSDLRFVEIWRVGLDLLVRIR